MSAGPQATDPDLEAIRARMREEILGRSGGATGTPPTGGPVDLTAATVTGFLSSNPRVVVDVWAPWCGPCRTMAPILDALARELAGEVRFARVNSDEEPALAGRWNVQGIPTLLLFEGGGLVDRVVGVQPQSVLSGRLRRTFRLPPRSPGANGR